MSYNLSLVSFQTTDNLVLPGLLYEPHKKTKKAAIWLHGNGSTSVFYSVDRMNTLGRIFTDAGITFFPFNNRGAHIIKSLKVEDQKSEESGEELQEEKESGDRSQETGGENYQITEAPNHQNLFKQIPHAQPSSKIQAGTVYELIHDCIHDIDGAIQFLQECGYDELYLLGHSSGANKICVYHYYKPDNPIAKYGLLAGGDDAGLFYQQVGEQNYKKAMIKCSYEIKYGNGEKMAPKYICPMLLSYQSLCDQIDPDGDYNIFPYYFTFKDIRIGYKRFFREYQSITKPTLVLYGSADVYCSGPVEKVISLLQDNQNPKAQIRYKIIEEADHGFSGYEEELGLSIADFLKEDY